MSNGRERRNDVDFFFGLPSELKDQLKQIAVDRDVSEAAVWRTAGRRLAADVKRGRRIEFR